MSELSKAVAALADEKRRYETAAAPLLAEIDQLAYKIIGLAVVRNPRLIERVPAERLSRARCELLHVARTGNLSSLQDAYAKFEADLMEANNVAQ